MGLFSCVSFPRRLARRPFSPPDGRLRVLLCSEPSRKIGQRRPPCGLFSSNCKKRLTCGGGIGQDQEIGDGIE